MINPKALLRWNRGPDYAAEHNPEACGQTTCNSSKNCWAKRINPNFSPLLNLVHLQQQLEPGISCVSGMTTLHHPVVNSVAAGVAHMFTLFCLGLIEPADSWGRVLSLYTLCQAHWWGITGINRPKTGWRWRSCKVWHLRKMHGEDAGCWPVFLCFSNILTIWSSLFVSLLNYKNKRADAWICSQIPLCRCCQEEHCRSHCTSKTRE